MAGYIGNRAVGLNVTTGDILGDVAAGGDVSVGDDLTVTDDAAIGGNLTVTGATNTGTLTSKSGSISNRTDNAGLIANASASFIVNHANKYGLYTGYINSTADTIGVAATRTGGGALPLSLQPFGGNVGIGTAAPGQLLEIDAGSGNNAGITIRMGTASSGANDSFIGFENSAGTEIFRTRYDNPTTSYVVESDQADPILTLTRAGAATLKNGLTLTDGNLVVANTHGIDFAATADGGNSASVASELLDHYEEGSWTPTAVGGGITIASVVKAGYNRTGNVVNIQMYITISAQGNSSALQIGGLPFGIPSHCYNVGAVDIQKSAHAAIYPRTESSSTIMGFYFSPANVSATRTVALGNDIGAGYVILSMTYML